MNINDMCKASGLTEEQIKRAVLFPQRFATPEPKNGKVGGYKREDLIVIASKRTGGKNTLIQTEARKMLLSQAPHRQD